MVLITGSLGLVGSACVRLFLERGHKVTGVDDNSRMTFFGKDADGLSNNILHSNYTFCHTDIRKLGPLFPQIKPDLIIHCAAQPSHDYASSKPLTDFSVNASATMGLLEATRRYAPGATFIYISTNKVYGDYPNHLEYTEAPTRFIPDDKAIAQVGFDENLPIDQCLHSLFGVSKLSGDLAVQEYGRYFMMNTACFRCGCITGAQHKAVEIHGFLAYVARCAREKTKYIVDGYNGKQVRDIIHADDVASACYIFACRPTPGAVFNMGGGVENSISVNEALLAFGMVDVEYMPTARRGDHIYWCSNTRKFRDEYPNWTITRNLKYCIDELKLIKPAVSVPGVIGEHKDE